MSIRSGRVKLWFGQFTLKLEKPTANATWDPDCQMYLRLNPTASESYDSNGNQVNVFETLQLFYHSPTTAYVPYVVYKSENRQDNYIEVNALDILTITVYNFNNSAQPDSVQSQCYDLAGKLYVEYS